VFVEVAEPWMLAQQDDWRQLRPVHAALAFMDLMTLWLVLEMVKGENIKLDIKQDGSGFGVRREDEKQS